MLFRPARIVRVTTKQEFDSALGSADQVIVEGEDELLSYAVAKASDDPQNRVSIEVGERSISIGDRIVGKEGPTADVDTDEYQKGYRDGLHDTWNPPKAGAVPTGRNVKAADRYREGFRSGKGGIGSAPPAPRSSRPAIFKVFRAFAVLLIPMVAIYLTFNAPSLISSILHPSPESAPSRPQSISPAPAPRPLSISPTSPESAPSRPSSISPPSPAPEAPVAPQSNIPAVLQALAWPAVSMVAILALFFIARQAITGGRNLEISWKVTEKITGRVVITKVRTRAIKERATA